MLRKAAPLWNAWTTARGELHRVFQGFWETADGRWRAQLLSLTDAERAAKAAAAAWDEVAETLARMAADQIGAAGHDEALHLTEIAQELGLDSSAWRIDSVDAYNPASYWGRETPLVESLNDEIEKQRERLREVAGLAAEAAPF
ncbi:hypothetical protein [Streptomyces sp. H39-C1]|uniref:hypothetical protein n=1 Tax=Streptomyces sp. H39-C1 TaxID=3004355 RepID=UPI0022B07C93|nr:hypothetical protein [Streptomyces sp. H39-C1]MCZ4098022.1 hypothetical protein [Streptomyces sp. H39-C1]